MSGRVGFTLIELMIVVAIIAILAAIAIPGLMRGKITSNETAAVAALRAVTTGESQFKQAQATDVDTDGEGEYGYFQEMGGTSNCRTNGGVAGPRYTPSSVQSHFGTQAASNGGVANRSGYQYLIYLPTAAGVAAAETAPLAPGNALDANGQESRWICYAWPSDLGGSGNRAFVVDQTGQIYQTTNTVGYDGSVLVPPPEAAIDPAGFNPPNIEGGIAAGANGTDGQLWTVSGG